MIEAQKGGPAGWLWEKYVERKLMKAFRRVWLRGDVPAHPKDRGVLVYANHAGFWDGFVMWLFGRAMGWDGYAVMEEKNLVRYPFLRRLGAFSLRRGEGQSALEMIRYTKKLLTRPGAAVAVWPEGELNAGPVLKPLHRGVALMAKAANALCLPVAVRYTFLGEELPEVLIDVGAAHEPAGLEKFTAELTRLHLGLQQVSSSDGFRVLAAGRRGVAERWDDARGLPAREDAEART